MKRFSIKACALVALLLVALLLLLAACGNRDDEDEYVPYVPDAPEQAQEQEPTPDTDDDVTPEPSPEPVLGRRNVHEIRDFGGRTLITARHIPFGAYLDEPDPATSYNYALDRMVWDNARGLEQDFNFVTERAYFADYDLTPILTASVMAGDPMAHMFSMSAGMWFPSAMNGLIHAIDTIDLPGSDILGPQIFGEMRGYALGHYWLTGTTEPNHDGHTLGINQDIIRAIGAPNPIDLYNNGQWTWEAMLDIMRLATRDTTGDGVLDQWGLAGQPGDIVVNLIVGSNDGVLVDDNFQYALDHPNTLEALEFADTIFREGLWQFCQETGPHGGWPVNFWAHMEGRSAFFVSHTWNLGGGDMPFEFNVVPFPTGPSNTSGNTWLGNDRWGPAFAVASPWEPAELLIIVDELFNWTDDLELMHAQGYSFSRNVFHSEDDVQRQVSVARTMNRDVGMIVPEFAWVFGTFVYHMIDQDMTIMQMIETYRPQQQEMLDFFIAGSN